MGDQDSTRQTKLEEAMAALTYIGFNWDMDRQRAHDNLAPLFTHFTMSEIREGALRALALTMISQAAEAEMSVMDYINLKIRPVIDESLKPESK